MAFGLAIVVSASTTTSFSSRSPPSSSGPMPSGAPGSLSRPASRTISSCTAGSSLPSALSTSGACVVARRSADPFTSSRTRSLLSLGSHPMSVASASARSSVNSSLSSSSLGCPAASSSDCSSCDNASPCDRRAGSDSSVWRCSGISSRARCWITLLSRRMKATERKSPAPSRYGMKFSRIEINSLRTVP